MRNFECIFSRCFDLNAYLLVCPVSINKIIGFNAHIVVDPFSNQIDKKKINDDKLKFISEDLIFSNDGESILMNKDFTKGIILRGYESEDFPKLQIIKNENFIGNKSDLIKNNISIGKELSFNLDLVRYVT